MKKRIQKDRPLPLKPAPKDSVFTRKDSRFWQARCLPRQRNSPLRCHYLMREEK